MKNRKLILVVCMMLVCSFALCMTGCTQQAVQETTPASAEATDEAVQSGDSTDTGSAESAVAAQGHGENGKYKIALCNSFMGNDWRVLMVKCAELAAKSDYFKDKIELEIVNSENTPEAQTSSIDALVEQDYDALLIDCASTTAIDSAMKRAEEKGKVVVTFDGVPDSEEFYKIESDWSKVGNMCATFIADQLDGKGNIVMDRGMVGHTISSHMYDGAMEVFDQYPDIKVVAEYESQFSEGPTEQGIQAALTSNPQIDAVFSQGYVGAIARAFEDAGRDIPVITGEGKNEAMGAAYDMDFPTLLWNTSFPGLSVLAINMAVELLDGTYDGPTHYYIQYAEWSTNRLEDVQAVIPDMTFHKIEEGVNYFPEYPPSLLWPLLPTLPESDPLYMPSSDFITIDEVVNSSAS